MSYRNYIRRVVKRAKRRNKIYSTTVALTKQINGSCYCFLDTKTKMNLNYILKYGKRKINIKPLNATTFRHLRNWSSSFVPSFSLFDKFHSYPIVF